MLRITKESEYAFLLLSELVDMESESAPKSAASLARETGIAAPMTGKVLKRLVRHRIVASTRGAQGGYRLARHPGQVTALEVVQAMEGSPELVDCVRAESDCTFAGHCRISPFWRRLNSEITQMLAEKTLAEMEGEKPSAPLPLLERTGEMIYKEKYL